MAEAKLASECVFKFVKWARLWDCTDGELHGGGKTQEAAYHDYQQSVADELFDSTIGWTG